MLSSKNMPYIKFGVYLLRKYICNSDSVNPLIMKRKQIYDEIINLYLDSKKLDYELKVNIINLFNYLFLKNNYFFK